MFEAAIRCLLHFDRVPRSHGRFHLDDTLKNQFCNKARLCRLSVRYMIRGFRKVKSRGKIHKFYAVSYRRIIFVRRSFRITQFIEL